MTTVMVVEDSGPLFEEMGVTGVAIIGKNNKPLVMHFVRPVTDLRFDYLLYASLDIIEDKIAQAKRQPTTSPGADAYFGFLFPSEDKRLYGYVTNTFVKFIAIVDDTDVREQDLRMFFKRLHGLFVEVSSNPFFIPDQPITSSKFNSKLAAIVKSMA